MSQTHRNFFLLLVTVQLMEILSLDCSSILYSTGVNTDDPSECQCQEDYFWMSDRCISIQQYFDNLQVASQELDVAGQTTCSTSQFASDGNCLECTSEVANCTTCTNTADTNSTSNSTSNSTTNSTIAVTCESCLDTFYLSNNQCQLCSSAITNCRLCSDANTCTECQTGFFLNTNGQCVGEEQDSNLGLILGVSIPVGVLMVGAVAAAIAQLSSGTAITGVQEEGVNFTEQQFYKDGQI